jgi:hypothetical protein
MREHRSYLLGQAWDFAKDVSALAMLPKSLANLKRYASLILKELPAAIDQSLHQYRLAHWEMELLRNKR